MSLIRKIIRNDSSITDEEYRQLLEQTFTNSGNNEQAIALLTALSTKSLDLRDILNLVDFIESRSPKQSLNISEPAINIVGTGGGISTFNISTTAAFVAASAGATILKSGSYSYNSSCGSLDILKKLGIKLSNNRDHLEIMLNELRIGFVDPNLYPPILKRIAISILPMKLRNIGGIINMIGPLLCPFIVHGQICGVNKKSLIDIFSAAFSERKMSNNIVVWSEIGIDEFSAVGKSYFDFSEENRNIQTFNPIDYGFTYDNHREICTNSFEDNIKIMETVLKDGTPSLAKNTVAVNAAFALTLAKPSLPVEEAIAICTEQIESHASYQWLQAIIDFSNRFK